MTAMTAHDEQPKAGPRVAVFRSRRELIQSLEELPAASAGTARVFHSHRELLDFVRRDAPDAGGK